jgi:hypothetical protein
MGAGVAVANVVVVAAALLTVVVLGELLPQLATKATTAIRPHPRAVRTRRLTAPLRNILLSPSCTSGPNLGLADTNKDADFVRLLPGAHSERRVGARRMRAMRIDRAPFSHRSKRSPASQSMVMIR